jgi:hypothetical protein
MRLIAKTALAAGGILAATALGYGAGVSAPNQPHMQNALKALEYSQTELQVAEHNKGGHRARALELVNHAINEVEAGIAAGNGR